MLVTLTVADLRSIVADAVSDALAEYEPTPAPTLLTIEQLSAHLQVSRSTVYAMRDRGMPVVMVLESPRFRLVDVLAWLESDSVGLPPRAEKPVLKVEAASTDSAVIPLVPTDKRKPDQLSTTGSTRGGRR